MLILSKEECLELESKYATYKEMIESLNFKMHKQHLTLLFKKYGIKHKSIQERRKYNFNLSNKENAIANNSNASMTTKLKYKTLRNMISYTVEELYDKRNLSTSWNFKFKGHANYANYGYDIVCASVSTAIQFAILSQEENEDIKVLTENGKITEISYVPSSYDNNTIGKVVFATLREFLSILEQQYPDNIKRVKISEFKRI